MRLAAWLRQRGWGLGVGALVTLAVLIAHGTHLTRPAELRAFDYAFRHFNDLQASDRIVMIDINDFALERVHRWPWPRRLTAELVSVIDELGAELIALDLTFSEPQTPRIQHPELSKDYDVDTHGEVLGEVTPEDAIYDDDELAAALKQAGNVHLGFTFQSTTPQLNMQKRFLHALQIVGDDPQITADAFLTTLKMNRSDASERFFVRARMAALVKDDFTISEKQLAQRLELPREKINRNLARVKQLVARLLVGDYLDEHPQADFAEVFRAICPNQPLDVWTADREDVLRAYRSVRSLGTILDRAAKLNPSLEPVLARSWDVTPPLDKFAAATKAVDHVVFERKQVLRRIPLLVQHDGRLIEQLGFGVAADLLNIDDTSFEYDAGFLTMSSPDGSSHWRVQVDRDGQSLINWYSNARPLMPEKCFVHIPVTRLMAVYDNRRRIKENDIRLALRTAEVVACISEDAYNEYATLVHERNSLRKQRRRTADLTARIKPFEENALAMLQAVGPQAAGITEGTPKELAQAKRIAALYRQFIEDDLAETIGAKNAKHLAAIDALIADLRPQIEGKVCFVGYTASAVADMVPTPVFEQMPGVLAHANILNMFIQNKLPREAPPWAGVMVILAAGIIMTLVTSTQGPWLSLASMIILLAELVISPMYLFRASEVLLVAVGPAAVTFLSWSFITLYRQLVEQRSKRQVAKALSAYVSPAIAREMTRQGATLDFAPVAADVTCLFSDLQNFTALSEQLGPENTKTILNPYLEAMSGALLARRAYVNKFIGDGIFAFFNPPLPVLEDPAHADTACRAAIDCFEALEKLQRDHRHHPLADKFSTLFMRIGISTGPVFVGDYGSQQKRDYTCIGDTVNFAARLESANKVFGTTIAVSGSTRQRVGDDLLFRYLACLQVKGKQQAEPVYELLGRTSQVNEDVLAYAELFGRAVEAFQSRDWPGAIELFEQCRTQRPTDPAIDRYLQTITQLRQSPPRDDWNGALTLTEK